MTNKASMGDNTWESLRKQREIKRQQLMQVDEDNMQQSELETIDSKFNADIAQTKSVSYLDPGTIRWIQKHRSKKANAFSAFVQPSRAIQLRAIFKGLDFDNSGELSLEELKEAIRYVATSSSSSIGDALFENPEKINQYFESMDIDKNGTVDFNEFLIAMTSEGSGGAANTMRLQNA